MMRILGLYGQKGVGKDFTAVILCKILEDNGKKVKLVAFADPLKNFINSILGIKLELLYGNDDDKNTPTKYRWEQMPKFVSDKFKETNEYMTVRHVMQVFGNELGREIWGQDIWIKAMLRRLNHLIIDKETDFVIVTDVRYENEVDLLTKCGGKIWKIHGERRGKKKGVDNHSSEQGISTNEFDRVVINGKKDSAKTLEKKLAKFLEIDLQQWPSITNIVQQI